MGFFSKIFDVNNRIGKINALLSQVENKINNLAQEEQSSYPNRERIRMELATISVLMSEISEVAGDVIHPVGTPFWLFGNKKNLFQISSEIIQLVTIMENQYNLG